MINRKRSDSMEQFVIDQIREGLKYIPANLLKSCFVRKSSPETRAMRERGFIRGVCHPTENFSLLKDAAIEWIRIDINYPFDRDGNLSPYYLGFKDRCRQYAERGIKVMAVTPYPKDYIENGVDVRTPDGEERLREIARFLVEDLGDLVAGYQVTNEMGLPHFTLPLTMAQAVRFIGVQLEAMYPVKGDKLVGYNSGGPGADLHPKLKDYYQYCDYVGVDIYLGCFDYAPGAMWMFDAIIRYLWALTKKPILLQEFGYISGGAPKSKREKTAVLNRYGAKDETDAKENIERFVANLPEHFRKHVEYVCGKDPSRYYNLLFRSDLTNHLYCELPAITKIPGYDHTPEGQAKFYNDILQHLYDLPYVCGTIIYCWKDPDSCHVCGQKDCPTETRWGLVDASEQPKPSFYAVRKIFGRIKWLERTERK